MNENDFDRDIPTNAELVNQDSFERLRSKNRRKEVRRRLFYVIIALVLIVIVGLVCVITFFGLKSIEVRGNSRYSSEEILEASGLDTTKNLFSIDFDEVEAAIRRACPYVSHISFERVLPSTLVITVNEDVPGYCTEIHGDWFLLSEDLRVISRHDMVEEIEILSLPLVYLYLPEVDRAVAGEHITFSKTANYAYLLDFLNDLKDEALYPEIDCVDASDRYHMALYAEDGRYLIDVGTSDNLDTKLAFVGKVIEEAFNEFTIASINVEHVNQIIVLEQDRLFEYR